MRSMTGYGEATTQRERVKLVVQLRTLNHRHLDIQARIPREYLALEEEIRKAIRQRIARGRVEIFIARASLRGQSRTLELDEDLLAQYLRGFSRVKKKFGLKGNLDLSLLMNIPELFRLRDVEVRHEDERGLVMRTVQSALKKLERSREREGGQLKSDFLLQARQLREICAALTRETKNLAQSHFKEPREGQNSPETFKESPESQNWTLKGDVNEEIVRLKSHVKELAHLIPRREPIGKKLDFLLQEMHRELNTISSKLPNLPVVRLVLSGKEKVERIREQTQNIE